jgi:hypothetical protein
MSRSRPPDGRPSDGGYEARVLALKLIETCERSGGDSCVVISALSIVLGMVIADATQDPEVVEVAVETIHLVIAASNEDDHAGVLQ